MALVDELFDKLIGANLPMRPKEQKAVKGFEKATRLAKKGIGEVDIGSILAELTSSSPINKDIAKAENTGFLPPNSNVKKIDLKNQTVELFDDAQAVQQASGVQQKPTNGQAPSRDIRASSQDVQAPSQDIQAVPIGELPIGSTPGISGVPTGGLQEAAPIQQPSTGDGFFSKIGDLIKDPGTAKLLGELGMALSATHPQSGQFQLGKAASQRAENIIFKSLMKNLLGEEVNPEVPVAPLSALSAAGLRPELQVAAFNQVLKANEQKREFQSRNVVDLLNFARATKLLRPEEKDAMKQPSATLGLKVLPDGRVAPAGMLFKMRQDPLTGDYTIFQGFEVDRSTTKGDGTDKAPELKQFQLDEIHDGLITVFFEEARKGLAKLYGLEVANAGELLSALSNPLTSGIDRTKVRIAIASESPNAIMEYNRLASLAAQEILSGEANISRVVERITGTKLAIDEASGPKPTSNFGANSPNRRE